MAYLDTDSIIGEYKLADLISEFKYSKGLPVCTYVLEQKVIDGDGKKVLPYDTKVRVGGYYSLKPKDVLYLKNVLLSDFRLEIPSLVDGVMPKEAVVNITNPNNVPNVSRSNVSREQQEVISDAIGRALHLWILDHVKLEPEEKELLQLFLKKRYGQYNYCMKK